MPKLLLAVALLAASVSNGQAAGKCLPPPAPCVDDTPPHVLIPHNPNPPDADPVSRPEGLWLPTGVIFPDDPTCDGLPIWERFICLISR